MALISERARSVVDLKYFTTPDWEVVRSIFGKNNNELNLDLPEDEQYILRCLVKTAQTEYRLPSFLTWVQPMLDAATHYQKTKIRINHSFCYITVRHGFVKSTTDDVWHVDGFSTRISHIPEQNYIWCSSQATEVLLAQYVFPYNFDPLIYNVNDYFQDYMPDNSRVIQIPSKTICVFDPYVIHRRPPNTFGVWRTFIRISFTPIEINDVNNTINPFLPTNYTKDGVKDFRDKLLRYKKQ